MFTLKYLFRCYFRDGSKVYQTLEDISSSDPKKSAYFDVVQRLNEVETFTITDGRTSATVDLCDGSFTVNGAKFFTEYRGVPRGTSLELVYFRRRTESFNAATRQPVRSTCEFHIGWKSGDQVVTISLKG